MDGDGPVIRLAEHADFVRLQEIEVRAGAAFRDVGMSEIAEHDPPSVGTLARFVARGRAWVYDGQVCDKQVISAYVLVNVVDGCAHIEQLSADPAVRGRGHGRALVDHVDGWAREQGLAALTLTTFRDVPWNAPYYRRIGFAEVPATGGLAEVVAREVAYGLDPALRVCMRRELSPAPP